MADYIDALTVATEAALAAGEILRDEFHRESGPRGGHCRRTRQPSR